MKLLIAEDEPNIARLYKICFEERGHEVIVTHNGEDCLLEYFRVRDEPNDNPALSLQGVPFDAVILDYGMPKKDGMEAAREILAIVPKQRIVFASAYVMTTLQDAVKTLNRVVEMVQKPFEMDVLIALVEDTGLWKGLQELNVNVSTLKEMGVTHDQLLGLYDGLRKLQKGRGIAN